MQIGRSPRRSALLATLLIAPAALAGRAEAKPPVLTGTFGAYLSARFAADEADLGYATDHFLRVIATDPGNPDLVQQAFTAAALDGRPEAAKLARLLPGNQAAQLFLANEDARAGRWDAAEQRFAALPRQGMAQVLQPLLLAWAQQGAGRTDAALATLRPYQDGQRYRGLYALHAALISDLAGRTADAARLYRAAHAGYGGLNLRLGQILASWQARQGHPTEARATLRTLAETSPDLAIAGQSLQANLAARAVPHATDGLAEAYLALAASLRQQDTGDSTLLVLRYALTLRPDFTAARLLVAEIQDQARHSAAAMATLAPIAATDPLAPVVRLRRAYLTERLGNAADAIRDLEQMARDFPDRPEPLHQEGDLLRQTERFRDAADAYSRALERIPQPSAADWPLLYARAIAYDRAHDWPHAQADLERALELSPDQPSVLNYLGYSWTEQGVNLAQAQRMIERALELRPNEGSIVDSLGWVLLRQGEQGRAVALLERAAEAEPEDPVINGHLGDAYQAAGRLREAEFQWRRALTFHPAPDDAARVEAKLREIPPSGPAVTQQSTQQTPAVESEPAVH